MALFGLHHILAILLWKKLGHSLVIVISVALRGTHWITLQ